MKSIHAILLVAGCVALPAAMAAKAERGQVSEACKTDIKTLCPDVKPGGGRIKACLKEQKDKISEECKADLVKLAESRKAAKP